MNWVSEWLSEWMSEWVSEWVDLFQRIFFVIYFKSVSDSLSCRFFLEARIRPDPPRLVIGRPRIDRTSAWINRSLGFVHVITDSIGAARMTRTKASVAKRVDMYIYMHDWVGILYFSNQSKKILCQRSGPSPQPYSLDSMRTGDKW